MTELSPTPVVPARHVPARGQATTSHLFRLSGDDRASARLRAWLSIHLRRWNLEQLADDLLLIGAELSSNARRHGAGASTVAVTLRRNAYGRATVRLDVTDAGPGFDSAAVARGWYDPDRMEACGGRGLLLVSELSRRWGNGLVAGRHRVWAEIAE
ncbi:ATP-binding protein [Streptomyces sp. L2]|uniref:ATP-binding protein n=1 Tax=Streptomyces sp. L2 TaxID=2162665 RepID=UPI00101193E4|nr:ATP-binding protein [Streptomyces sp. L2]